jgi:hypothetical protein
MTTLDTMLQFIHHRGTENAEKKQNSATKAQRHKEKQKLIKICHRDTEYAEEHLNNATEAQRHREKRIFF